MPVNDNEDVTRALGGSHWCVREAWPWGCLPSSRACVRGPRFLFFVKRAVESGEWSCLQLPNGSESGACRRIKLHRIPEEGQPRALPYHIIVFANAAPTRVERKGSVVFRSLAQLGCGHPS